jgi:hypothetical protein
MQKYLYTFIFLFASLILSAQLNVVAEGVTYLIDFDNTVAGVNNGQFAGTGLEPAPAAGRLNSNAWRVTGMSDGNTTFGGTHTAGDFARGSSTGGESTGGLYAFEVAPGNITLGVQPAGSDYTPGTYTLLIENNTGDEINEIDIAYIVYVYNDQPRANLFNFAYSLDDVTYFTVPALNLTSPEAAGAAVWVANARSTTLTGLSIQPGESIYLQWQGDDVSGSGGRDEFALDDIEVTFRNTGVIPPPPPAMGWQITDLNIPFIIDFDNTVANVNESVFAGAGFSPTPDPGQLNSNAFITGGWSDAPNSIEFGETSPTTGDFARGTNVGTTATGGIWGFDVGGGNSALGFKPGGSDFTPGFITLRLQNQTGQPVGGFELSYNLLVFNNGNRGNTFNFSYSFDNLNFFPVDSLDFVSPETADGNPTWQSNLQSTFIEDFTLNPGQFFYLRWDSDDAIGSGSRDAFALDDIEVIAIARLDLIVPTMGEWALMILGLFFMLLVTIMVKAPLLFGHGIVQAVKNLPVNSSLKHYLLTGVVCYLVGLSIALLFYGGFGSADVIGGLIFSQLAAYWLYFAILPEKRLVPETR